MSSLGHDDAASLPPEPPLEPTPPEATGGGDGGGTVPFSVTGRLRAYFFAGILITAPISITIYLAWLFLTFIDSKVTPLIPSAYNPNTYLPFGIPGLGLVVLVVFLTVIGALTAGFFGRLFVRISEAALARMPVIRGIYGAVKQIVETIFSQKSTAFRKVVLVEWPRRGSWALGFLTGKTQGEVQRVTDEDMLNVLLLTTPNPTSGFLIFLPKSEVRILDMTVEEAMKMIVSGGIVVPPDPEEARAKAAEGAAKTRAGGDQPDRKHLAAASRSNK